MRGMISTAQGALLRAVERFLQRSAGRMQSLVVEATSSHDWASATFTGQRHRLDIRFTGGDAAHVDALVKTLAEAELAVPGHIVASVEMVEHEMHDGDPAPAHRLVLEALTIVD